MESYPMTGEPPRIFTFRSVPATLAVVPMSQLGRFRNSRPATGMSGLRSGADVVRPSTQGPEKVSSVLREVTPVMFPPGRLRHGTIPFATGSPPVTKTIGIVEVAAFAC